MINFGLVKVCLKLCEPSIAQVVRSIRLKERVVSLLYDRTFPPRPTANVEPLESVEGERIGHVANGSDRPEYGVLTHFYFRCLADHRDDLQSGAPPSTFMASKGSDAYFHSIQPRMASTAPGHMSATEL